MKRTTNIAITLLCIAGIIIAVAFIWDRYMYSPWTRDGRVRAEVVNIAPDVSGWIDTLNAHNAQNVKKGEVLFTVDRARYQVALDLAMAKMEKARVAAERATHLYNRRASLKNGVVSHEEVDTAHLDMLESQADYKQAVADVDSAKLDLARTVYKSPESGKIINLSLERGDYVTQGSELLALVKNNSYYITGYFEETKIPAVKIGDKVEIWLMAGTTKLSGHVESIDSGISNTNTTPGNQMLPAVEPTFAWVRLAQRIPVNIKIDAVPDNLVLSSGMSATVKIITSATQTENRRSVLHALKENLKALF
ncbi:efflux RND transporter periplasmic adaptor subunit [Pluralibacter gergoviae]|uniref:efflux RND transporter periplasmic adaptor subunit n=1 Tax=Pluralibacter gergoviae TaxID=61647 RepID=UPI000AD28B7E|nr:HlyD family secretion protein [Pluralibacter gergoviae]